MEQVLNITDKGFDIDTDHPINMNNRETNTLEQSYIHSMFDMKTYFLNYEKTICLITGFELNNNVINIFFYLQDIETGRYLKFNVLMFKQLLIELNIIFDVNIQYPNININNHIIRTKEICFNRYKIFSNLSKDFIIIDKNTLYNLFDMNKIMSDLMNYLEFKRNNFKQELNIIIEHCIKFNIETEKDLTDFLLTYKFDNVGNEFKFDFIINLRTALFIALQTKRGIKSLNHIGTL